MTKVNRHLAFLKLIETADSMKFKKRDKNNVKIRPKNESFENKKIRLHLYYVIFMLQLSKNGAFKLS